jgi:hypothetical protein
VLIFLSESWVHYLCIKINHNEGEYQPFTNNIFLGDLLLKHSFARFYLIYIVLSLGSFSTYPSNDPLGIA